MNGFSKTRSSGFIILIVLLLILIMVIVTVLTRMSSEDKLIRLGFVKLQQYSTILQSKIDVLYTTWKSGNVNWKHKNYYLRCENDRWYIKDTNTRKKEKNDTLNTQKEKNDTMLDITDIILYDILDRTFFEEYIIFDDNNVLYNTLKTEIFESGKYLESLKTNLYLPTSNRMFSLNKSNNHQDTTGNSGFITKTIINYEKYYQFVYPFKIQNKKFYISGLLTGKKYLNKKQHVESWVIIVIGILLLLTLFSFPFIKLFLLSKTERLKTSDLVLICFSAGGIACVVSLLIINFNTLSRIRENSKDQLERLSDSIKSNFIAEINLMYQTVESYEVSKKSDYTVKKHILTDSIFESSDSCLMYKIMAYPYFKGLFCSDAGMSDNIITTWGTDTSSRISYRDYYKKKDEWLLPGPGKDKRFRLQSIFSNTSGDASAVLAKPSKTFLNDVYCISSPMFSVINTILPPGFEFRIIGQDGLVWFHNNQQKNTRENFLVECDHSEQIQAAIYNRVETSFSMKISLQNYQVHISPIATLPLYMITLCNSKEQNEFYSHVNYVVFIFFVIGLLFAAISSAVFYYGRTDKFTETADDCEPGLIWLLADSRKNKRYLVIFSLNIFLGFLISLPVFFVNCTILHFLLIIFSAYSLCFLYTYILLKSTNPKVIKKSIIIMYALIIVVCNLIYLIFLTDFMLFLIPEILAITIIGQVVCMVQNKHLFPKLKRTFLNSGIMFLWSPKYPCLPYSLFMSSWLVIACIMPTIFLFKIAGREEVDLITRKNQLEIASRIERKGILIDSFYVAHIYPDKNHMGDPALNTLKAELKQKGNYLLDLSYNPVTECVNTVAHADKVPDPDYLLLNKYLRLLLSEEDFRTYQMLYGAGLDTTWFWECSDGNKKSDILTFHYLAKQKDAGEFYSGYQFRLSSVLQNQKTAKMTNNYKSVLFFTAVYLFFLISLFLLIRLIIKKLFIIRRPEIPNIIDSPEKINNSVNIFLINTLYSNQIKNWMTSYDIIEPDQTLEPRKFNNVLIILNPLPDNPDKWNIFIDNLKNLIKKNSGQVILLAPYAPLQIREIIEEQIQNISIADPKDATATKDATAMKDALNKTNQRLMQLFSCFVVSFIEVKNYSNALANQLGINNCELENDLVIGNIEGALIPKSEKVISNNINLPGSETDVYSLLITQYQYLWKNCTTNEKFILLDLSTDSLVNGKNREDIKNLIGKGILDVKGKLCFVSNGFKRYVTELAYSGESLSIENNSKRVDGWNKIKNPLYIIFGAIVVFFFFTQHDLITGLNGAIISITGILGTLMKVFSGRSSETAN